MSDHRPHDPTNDGATPIAQPLNGPAGSEENTIEQPVNRPDASEIRNSTGRFGSLGMPGETTDDFAGSTRRLMDRLRPDAALTIVVLILAIVSATLTSLGPRQLGHATTTVFVGVFRKSKGGPGIDFTALHAALFRVMALYIAAGICSYVQARILAGVVQRTMRTLRADVEDKLNRLPLSYIDRQPRGDLLSRVTNDIDNLAQSLQQTLSQMLTSVLSLLGVLTMMVWISPTLAIVALVTIPISWWTMKAITKRSKAKFTAQWMHTGSLNAQVEEAFTGHSLVKVFGRQHDVEQRFQTENQALYRASFAAQFYSGCIQPAMMFLGNLNYVVIAVVGGLRVSSGTMTLGDVQAFIQYSRQFTQPLTQVASMANVMQSGIASAERIFQLLDAPEQSPDPADAATVPESVGRVAFENISFSYDPANPLIEDLSLVAEPGRTVAIVGPTGAGKTTLVNLIMRFYELNGGRITLDGVDIASLRRDELRGNIGMVLQDTWLFGGTIRDNIAYGNLEATEEQIRDAARATYVDRFVHSLPLGYDTVINDEGTNLSAGEKQLVTIARAFLSDPTILILDEATSSVDTRTEVLIQRAMNALRSQRTSFVIAHRLSTIRDADVILVMDGGKIVEQGNHNQLLAAHGAYFTLYNSQFAAAAAELQ